MVLWRFIVKYAEEKPKVYGVLSFIERKTSNYSEIDFKSHDLGVLEKISPDFIRLDIIKWDPPEEFNRNPREIYTRFIQYVSNEEYWYAHEEIEELWKMESGQEKERLRKIILLLASMVHYQMNHLDVSRRLFRESVDYLIRDSLFSGDIKYSYPLSRELVLSLTDYLDKYTSHKQYEEYQAENKHGENYSLDGSKVT